MPSFAPLSSLLLSAALIGPVAAATCTPAPDGRYVDAAPGVRLHVRTIGQGRPVLFIPSLGRSVADFDDLARRLAPLGVMSVLPEPRGAAGSTGPRPSNLFELARDDAAVLAALCEGAVDVVGHAFGNRVARALASSRPETVSTVVLLAGGGETQMPPAVRAALEGAASQGLKPDAERLADLRLAFFAPGHDPAVWLQGWSPALARAQGIATWSTAPNLWWTAGQAEVLLVQAADDPVAPPGNAQALRRDIGDRAHIVTLPHASHAMLPEQPDALAAVVAAWLGGQRDEPMLQRLADDRVR